jgi:WhiB family redox-sensing transcriptional regulator
MTHNETVAELRAELDRLVTEHNPNLMCQQAPDLYFPDDNDSKVSAYSKQLQSVKKGCERCPIQQQCAAYGIAAGEEWGIWGGTTPYERRLIRQRLGIPSHAEQQNARAFGRPLD